MAQKDSTKAKGKSGDSDDDDDDDGSLRRGSTAVVLVLVAPVTPNLGAPPSPKDEADVKCRNTSLEVYVVNSDRKPVHGARVSARWHPKGSSAWKECPPQFTDGKGMVKFPALPLGKGQAAIEEFAAVGGRGLSARRTARLQG